MIGVIVTIALGTRYDAEVLRAEAAGSRARFEGLPASSSLLNAWNTLPTCTAPPRNWKSSKWQNRW